MSATSKHRSSPDLLWCDTLMCVWSPGATCFALLILITLLFFNGHVCFVFSKCKLEVAHDGTLHPMWKECMAAGFCPCRPLTPATKGSSEGWICRIWKHLQKSLTWILLEGVNQKSSDFFRKRLHANWRESGRWTLYWILLHLNFLQNCSEGQTQRLWLMLCVRVWLAALLFLAVSGDPVDARCEHVYKDFSDCVLELGDSMDNYQENVTSERGVTAVCRW